MRLEPVHDRRARRRFVELARRFRSGSEVYVPPLTGEVLKLLDPQRNPALRHARQGLWIATDDGGTPIGRVAATYDPRHAENLGEKAGWFGFFDARDAETTEALVRTACDWLRAQGATAALGPADPDTNHECGCLIEGFEQMPYIMMPHHPETYAGWFEQAGLVKAKDLLAYETHTSVFPYERLQPIVDRILGRDDVVIEHVTKRKLTSFLDVVCDIYNRAWHDNWGFLPMTPEEFAFESEGLKMLVDPDFTMVALQGGNPAGFILGVPDPNPALHAVDARLFPFGIFRLPFLLKKAERMRVIALGVIPEFRRRGLELALVHKLASRARDRGVHRADMSWVLEDNLEMNGLARQIKGEVTRRYRVYRADLD